MLKIKDFSVAYGSAVAVESVSLDIASSNLVAVLGANGAGKSSLGKGIAGIARSKGEITFEGEDIGGATSSVRVKKGIVYVPEGRHVFKQLTVDENLRAGAFVRRRKGDWRARRDELYDRVPRLRDRSGARAGLLSGGEQQLLALCRAMMAEPKLLILDEPSLGLAPMAMNIVAEFLGEVAQDTGLGILLLEQNVAFATRMAQRAYIMRLGSLEMEVGRDVLDQPEAVRDLLTQGTTEAPA